MLKIFLSSTFRDLQDARREILTKLDAVFEGVGMEKFISDGKTSHEICIGDLKKSKIVVFLLSSNYGSLIDTCQLKQECKVDCIMKKGEGEGYQISYTHCEYKTTLAQGILHQTYKVLDGWETQIRPEVKQFEEEIGKEMWTGIPDINDPNVVPLVCNNLAIKLVEWHTQDRLNFKKFIDREEVLNEIIDNIDSKIEVWGVGGVGKTALVQVALLVEKLKGRKIVTIGTTKSYKSGSGFKDFRKKCTGDQYITESQNQITLYDVVKALEKVQLISNAEEIISSLQQKEKIIYFLSKFLNEHKKLLLFIDDFHLATEGVEKLVDSLESIILSSRKNSNIAEKEICIVGIDEEDREDLIKLFNPNIPENAKKSIKHIAEGHPVATELLVKNYMKIDFDKIKDFELVDADNKQVEDFYKRVIEEIFSSTPQSLTLLKDLAVLNTDLSTNINKESVLRAYHIENVRMIFNSLVDTGMLIKRKGNQGTYEFYFKHIQDYLEDEAKKESHNKAVEYYERKREIFGESINEAVEILNHKVKSNPTEELIDELREISEEIQHVHYGFRRLFDVVEELSTSLGEEFKAPIDLILGKLYSKSGRVLGTTDIYAPTSIEEARANYNQGVHSFQNNDFENAIKFYEKAISIDPNYVDAYDNLGLVYRHQGNLGKSEYYYKKSIEIYPNGFVAHQNLAIVYGIKKVYDKMANEYEIMKKIDPNDPEGYYGIARLYLELGYYDLALENAQKALELYEEVNHPYIKDGQFLLGLLYYNWNDKKNAEIFFKKAKENGADIPRQFSEEFNI